MIEIIRTGTTRLPKEFIGTVEERNSFIEAVAGDIWYTDNGTDITEVCMYNGSTGWRKFV